MIFKNSILSLIIFFVLNCVYVSNANTATINAASCSFSHVQTAINSTNDGDTVQIPNGTCTWNNNTLTITKAITLKGNGVYAISDSGHPRTDLGTWPLTIDLTGYTSTNAIVLNVSTGSLVRITGIQFTGAASGSGDERYGLIKVESSNNTNWRIDNCKFHHTGRAILTMRADKGLIDHVFIISDTCTMNGEIAVNDTRNGTDSYRGSWATAQPITWGGPQFVFIEDSCFIKNGCVAPGAQSTLDTNWAGRYVFRYNYTYDGILVWHGLGSGGDGRSGNAFEIYNNEFYWHVTGNRQKSMIGARGGTALVHHNSFTNYQGAIALRLERRDSVCASRAGGCCDGTKAWDGNLGAPYPAGYP